MGNIAYWLLLDTFIARPPVKQCVIYALLIVVCPGGGQGGRLTYPVGYAQLVLRGCVCPVHYLTTAFSNFLIIYLLTFIDGRHGTAWLYRGDDNFFNLHCFFIYFHSFWTYLCDLCLILVVGVTFIDGKHDLLIGPWHVHCLTICWPVKQWVIYALLSVVCPGEGCSGQNPETG